MRPGCEKAVIWKFDANNRNANKRISTVLKSNKQVNKLKEGKDKSIWLKF